MKIAIILLITISSIVSAETIDIAISNFKFTPNDITINVGDTVRWTNTQGFHDVTEDNNIFSSGPASAQPYVFEHTFNSVEEILYHCTIHSTAGRDINTFMNGRIKVLEGTPPFVINQGISGAWFNPDTSGSGILFDIRETDNFLFAAWFTYDIEAPAKFGSSDNRWFSAQGNYVNGLADSIGLFQSSGGIFDNSHSVLTEQIGNITFDFSDCGNGTVTYSITADQLTGTFPIIRVIPGTESLCESLADPNQP
jgi:plastocyanin